MNEIKRIQDIQKRMLGVVVNLCNENNIRYYVAAGTLLGTVRHKGFIPWDDDVDIVIPRKDYDRFMQLALTELPKDLELRNYKTYDGYHLYYMRVVDKHSKVIPTSLKFCERYTGVWLDVFPLDAIPNGRLAKKLLFLRVLYYKGMLALHYNDANKKRYGIKKLAVSCLKWYAKRLSPQKIKQKLDKVLSSNDYGKCQTLGNLFGGYGFKECFDKNVYGQGTTLNFEGIEVNAPMKYHEVLEKLYCDYMTPPPEEQRIGHQLEIEYLSEKDKII